MSSPSTATASDLEIVKDHQSDFYQWFYFRVAGARGATITCRILNAGGSAYPDGWPGYMARVSHDRETWRLTDTRYADGVLEFTLRVDTDLVWFAYFAPYTMERHNELVAASRGDARRRAPRARPDARRRSRSIASRVGTGPKPVWLYARQHPGESMAEWWMEGALERLPDTADPVTRRAARKGDVPHRPQHEPRRHAPRPSAHQRRRHEPQPRMARADRWKRAPKCSCVRDAMDETGVDFAMDVHGDEAIPANFLAGFEGIPSLDRRAGRQILSTSQRRWPRTRRISRSSKGYAKSAPGKANLSMSTNQLAERFGAVSMTLEMPFKDHDANPDAGSAGRPTARNGWRTRCLETLAQR